jgi:hypothetical protein
VIPKPCTTGRRQMINEGSELNSNSVTFFFHTPLFDKPPFPENQMGAVSKRR